MRGTLTDIPFKGRVVDSNGDYGWLLMPQIESNEVVVTEAPIDAISIVAFYPDSPIRDSYLLALGGLFLKTLDTFLESHTEVDTIVLAVDNDVPASEFVNTVKNTLGSKYEVIEFRPAHNKDWNEVLLSSHVV